MVTENLKIVEEKICRACERCGRDRREVTLIAVSKTKPVEMIREAIASGIFVFGENKVQEMLEKQELLGKQELLTGQELHWHMIGHLQRNKVKQLVGRTAMIHSVDSLRLAEQIENEFAKKDETAHILVEVNMAKEDTKFGIMPEETEGMLRQIANFQHIRVHGLMTIAPFVENPEENRVYFRNLHKLLVDINNKNIDNISMDKLSMGMTGDYEVAIEEGATFVRVGTGIFGNRQYI